MAIRYKIDVISELKQNGYTWERLIKEEGFGSSALHGIKQREVVGTKNLNKLCKILKCQPGMLIEYIPDPEDPPEVRNG